MYGTEQECTNPHGYMCPVIFVLHDSLKNTSENHFFADSGEDSNPENDG